MGFAPCLLLALLAVHHVTSLGAPQPVSSLDAQQQEIVDFAVVQLQVSCRVEALWEFLWNPLSRAESMVLVEGSLGWRNSANRQGASGSIHFRRLLLQMVAGILYKFDLVLEHNQDDSECQQVG